MTASWQAGWVAGDIVTAAEFAKGVGMVFDSTLGSDAASIDTGAIIPSGYAHLGIFVYARSAAVALGDAVRLRFNNDSGANYDSMRNTFISASTSYNEYLAGTSAVIGGCPANNAPANAFGTLRGSIAHYSQATNHKAIEATSQYRLSTATGGQNLELAGGTWFAAAAAITRITVFAQTANLRSGSRLTVYAWGD